jgi:uncharacterized alpha-E superfamily protein
LNDNPDLLTDTTYWKHLLLSIGGYELYLKTYRSGFEAKNVLEQVALKQRFPPFGYLRGEPYPAVF